MIEQMEKYAFGWPGIPARWTSGAKTAVGTALNPAGKVWFSLSHGIVNELYYPQVDNACTRDAEFLVCDGNDFFSEEKRDTTFSIKSLGNGVPGYRIITRCKLDQYTITKDIIADPLRDALLVQVRFEPRRPGLRLYFLLAPHIGNHGNDNTAWFGKYKGFSMLFADRQDTSLAVACSRGWRKGSAGFVGFSDGWQDLYLHKKMQWQFERAENGNCALMGEISVAENDATDFSISIGFGRNTNEAGMRAMAGILNDFERTKKHFRKEWSRWQRKLWPIENYFQKDSPKNFRISASMLKVHESKRHPGAYIASLSIPWGFSKGDDALGGYHLVWPRDMVQVAGGLLAINAFQEARKVMNYLMITQEEDGHWSQNMWLDGAPYWSGIQMDQTAAPILLMDLIHREIKLSEREIKQFWPMMKKAAVFLVHNGPRTNQDRWEENAGYSTYTLATEIAALVIAADFAELMDDKNLARFLLETADSWNSCLEWWMYAQNTSIAHECNVDGYYVRVNASLSGPLGNSSDDVLTVSNRTEEDNTCLSSAMVSPDAIALVRFGLRGADDERIQNTIQVLDKLIKFEGPGGPIWYRYNKDGYGEKKNGEAYDGTGEGRPWPLLTGERAHFELAAGNREEAFRLLKTMENYSNEMGLFSEQIWDDSNLPAKELQFGKPTGAAMPLVWAHAEYLKLCRSIAEGKIYDQPVSVYNRYVVNSNPSNFYILTNFSEDALLPHGKNLRLHCLQPAHVSLQSTSKIIPFRKTQDTGIGIHYLDLNTLQLNPGEVFELRFANTDDINQELIVMKIQVVSSEKTLSSF
jgi:glucoamylase